MRVFKNKVGRPSNETLRNRKIISLISFSSLFLLIFIVVFLYKQNTNSLLASLTAKSNNCNYYIDAVGKNSVIIRWYCRNGKYVDNYSFYDSNTKRIKYFNSNSKFAKSDRLLISGFSTNKTYKVGFHDSTNQNRLITFKTSSGGKVQKENLIDERKPSPAVGYSTSGNKITISWIGYGTKINSLKLYYGITEKDNCYSGVSRSGKYNNLKIKDDKVGSDVFVDSSNYRCYTIVAEFQDGTKTTKIVDLIPKTTKKKGIFRKNYNVKNLGGDWPSYVNRMNSYLTYVYDASKKYSVSPDLIMAIIFVESKGNKDIYNKSSNCYGLMQVNGTYSIYKNNQTQLYNPKKNIDEGTSIIKTKLKKFGNVSNALCHYNAGDYSTKCGNYSSKVLDAKKKVNLLYTFYN